MYKYFVFIIFVLGCSSDSTNSNNSNTIEELQKAAMKQYMDSPVLALPMMEKLANLYAENKDFIGASGTYYNMATIYETTLDEKNKAILYGNKSLETAKLAKDDAQQAKLLQYVGYLKGQTGNSKDGKKDIVDAVMKYKSLNDENGVATSQFNLARVFYIEGALDESAHFLNKALSHYRNIKDDENIFYNNLFAISLYSKMQQTEKLQAAINENKSLIPSIKYEGYHKLEFERLLKEYDQ